MLGLGFRVSGTDNRDIRESQRVKGLRSKLSPKEFLCCNNKACSQEALGFRKM